MQSIQGNKISRMHSSHCNTMWQNDFELAQRKTIADLVLPTFLHKNQQFAKGTFNKFIAPRYIVTAIMKCCLGLRINNKNDKNVI